MIYTSRYSNRELANGDYYAVGISRGKPKFQIDYHIYTQAYIFAPDRSMWNAPKSSFRRMYRAKLDRIGTEKVRRILRSFESAARGRDVVLLCFEDVRIEEDWCHRTMLAEWVEEKLGFKIKELYNPDPPKGKSKERRKDMGEQLMLFQDNRLL